MKMYIGNCTRQPNDFQYRMPGEANSSRNQGGNLRVQRVEALSCLQMSGELTSDEVDYIVQQHAPYGLVHVTEVDRTKSYLGLCWDTKPINVHVLREAISHNQEVLEQRGRDIRKEAAVALNTSLEDAQEMGELKKLTIEVKEDKSGSMEHDQFAETIQVSRDAPASAPPPAPKRAAKRRVA
jgi:hypothetical protein